MSSPWVADTEAGPELIGGGWPLGRRLCAPSKQQVPSLGADTLSGSARPSSRLRAQPLAGPPTRLTPELGCLSAPRPPHAPSTECHPPPQGCEVPGCSGCG